MSFQSARQKAFDLMTVLGLAGVAAGLIVLPSQTVEAARGGVELCFNVLIPSLFPFFVLSSLTVELGLADGLGRLMSPLMEPLFNVGGGCAPALILGFIGGYPVGAKTVINLYQSKKCSRREAERMLAFCNNSGPAFIFGVVGAGIFSSSAVGLTLYLTHLLASVLVGLIFRGHGGRGGVTRPPRSGGTRTAFPAAFVKAVSSSFQSCLGICGFVIFFSVLLKLLFLSGLPAALGSLFGLLGLEESWAFSLLSGLLELTSGVWTLRGAPGGLAASVAMAAFMLGWAGLSVHCQVLSFLQETGLSAKTYLLGKLLHGLLSAGLAAIAASFLSVDTPVGAFLAMQLRGLTGLDFAFCLSASAVLSALLLALFLLASRLFAPAVKKTGGKKGPPDV